MWSKIWQWLAGIMTGLAALAFLLLKITRASRDEARRKAESAKRSHRATQKKSDDDASIRKAGAKARQESAQAAEVRNEQNIKDRRSSGGNFGDHSRLRK